MKLVKSLHQKKYRDRTGLFLVEGIKLVGEALQSDAKVEMIAYSGESEQFPYRLPNSAFRVSEKDLRNLSALRTPNRILAVCHKPKVARVPEEAPWVVAFDGVADPGNFGTIIRICDWFGIEHLACSPHCVDVHNPKVVQASMGSIFRVKVHYLDLKQFLSEGRPVFVADTKGESVYDTEFPDRGVLVMGSESHGPSSELVGSEHRVLAIPGIGRAESLNVAVSAGIILSHLRRSS
jgi:TrmH family RNA methyltransferase